MRNLINDSNTTQRKKWALTRPQDSSRRRCFDFWCRRRQIGATRHSNDYFERNSFHIFLVGLSSTDTEHVYGKIHMKNEIPEKWAMRDAATVCTPDWLSGST